ncbi:sporulation protein YjcZ [Chengkuizengella sp. SCS-71B]
MSAYGGRKGYGVASGAAIVLVLFILLVIILIAGVYV